MWFTCNIGEGAFLAARHVVVVEVHHDNSFFLLLQGEHGDGHGDEPEQSHPEGRRGHCCLLISRSPSIK